MFFFGMCSLFSVGFVLDIIKSILSTFYLFSNLTHTYTHTTGDINIYILYFWCVISLITNRTTKKAKQKVYESRSNKKINVALSSATFEGRVNDYYIFAKTNTNIHISIYNDCTFVVVVD